MSEEGRASGKAERSLERLRNEFPLERRVTQASASARRTYAKILAHWLDADAPPKAAGFPRQDLEDLATIDAISLTEDGVSAYPFSARDTGISVLLDGRRLGVMCAIDALAAPLLADKAVTIEASCERCGKPVVLEARPDGTWTTTSATPIRVRYSGRRDAASPCCSDLCPTIRFVLAGCEGDAPEDYLDLAEATAVARGMFAFQVPLVQAERERAAASA